MSGEVGGVRFGVDVLAAQQTQSGAEQGVARARGAARLEFATPQKGDKHHSRSDSSVLTEPALQVLFPRRAHLGEGWACV